MGIIKKEILMATKLNDDYQKDLDDSNCCMCIPLKTGLKLISLYEFVVCIVFFSCCIYAICVWNYLNTWIYMIMGIPGIFVCFNWIVWLKDDNKHTRKIVVRWMRISMLMNFLFTLMKLITELNVI